jgi:hypothetical protein
MEISENTLVKEVKFTVVISNYGLLFVKYTSVHNATYLFASPFCFHNMFRPYMAIIMCSFAKNCFTVWYIPLFLSHKKAICPNLK